MIEAPLILGAELMHGGGPMDGLHVLVHTPSRFNVIAITITPDLAFWHWHRSTR
jgi:hypothetical protein